MANKSVKQQLYEQLANQHVQQALNNIGLEQFQKQYEAWNSEQEGLAAFEAQYNAWNEANPVQAPEPQPTPQPIQQPAQVKKVPVLNKPKVNMEDYQRQQQEEQMLASNISEKDAQKIAERQNRKDSVNNFVNAINSKEVRDAVKKTQAAQLTPTTGKLTEDQKRAVAKSTTPEKANYWLSSDVKLSDRDKQEARAYASSELQKFNYGPNRQPVLRTTEDRQHYADMVNLMNKTNPVANTLTGVMSQPYNLAKTIRNGVTSLGNQLGGLAAAIGDKTGLTQGATQRFNESRDAANQLTQQNDANMQTAKANAQTQNPVGYTAGQIGGQIGMYMLTNPVFDSIASGAGVTSELAKYFINQGAQNAQDLALDTAPLVNELMADGSISEQDKRSILNNILINAGGNAVMGGLQQIPNIRRYMANRNAVPGLEDVDNVVRNATDQANAAVNRINELSSQIPTRQIDDAYNQLPTLEEDVLNANNNQFRDLMNTYNNQFKDTSAMRNIFTPEDMDAATNRQFRSLMDENLIPERMNPIAEMEDVTPSQLDDEIRAMNDEMGNMWGDTTARTADNVIANNAEDTTKNLTDMFKAEGYSDDQIKQMVKNPTEAEIERASQFAANNNVGQSTDNALPASVKQYVDNPNLSSDVNADINDYLFPLEQPFTEEGRNAFRNVVNNITMQSEEGYNIVDRYYTLSDAIRKTTDDAAEAALKGQLDELRTSANSADKSVRGLLKDALDYMDAETALADYKRALNGDSEEAVTAAARNLDAIRNRIARRKGTDKNLAKMFSGGYGKAVKRPKFAYSTPPETVDEDLVNGWIEYDAERAAKASDSLPSLEKPKTPKGAYDLQFYGSADDDWATSALRTNSMNKTGLINDPDDVPVDDYVYRKYRQAEQRADFGERYADSKDLVRDLVEKDAFDEVDMRGAASTWRELMESGSLEDIRKANRLGRKMSVEGREGGRLVEAIKEMNRNTPDGQLQEAQDVIGQAIDKRVGKGTSESLDNLFEKISQAYDGAKTKEDFLEDVKKLLDGDLKQYASPKTAKDMQSKKIKGVKKILDMINKAEDLSSVPMDDVMQAMYKSNGGVALSPQAQKEIYDLLVEASKNDKNSYKFRALQAQAARKVMAEVPSGLGDYIRAFLYDNMLGNFKTAFSRNFMGNVAYQSLEKIRELPTAAVDWATSKVTGKRSALGWNADKAKAYAGGFKKGAVEQTQDTFRTGANTARSGDNTWAEVLKNNRTVHNDAKKVGHFANEVDRLVENVMKYGDRPIYEANYAEFKTELEQLVNRYGKNGVAGLENVEDKYIEETIDNLAKVRAADAVFQKQGKMSEGLTELRDGLGDISRGAFGVDILSTASAPFTLTPGNMLERAIEYTPVGAAKNLIETAGELGKGTFNQRRFAEEAGRTITGLPVLAATYYGAKNGLVNGGYSTDPDEKQAQIDDGFIEYSLNVPDEVPLLGGKQLDTSDLPVYGPFMQAGAVMAENGISPESSLQAAEAITGSSALQGVRRAFGADSSSYSSQDSLVDNLANTIKSSGTQFVPSLVRQTAYATDKYKRDLGEYRTNEYYLNSIKNSIPGLRETLPIKTDVEGEKVLQNQGRNTLSKIAENYILPMNISEYKQSPLNKEASRLLEATDKAWAFQPKALRKDLRQWDEKSGKEFTERQFRRYKEDLGKKNTQMGNALLDSKYYKGLDDEAKVETMQSVYSAMKALAKENVTGIKSDDKIVAAYKKNKEEGVLNYLQGKSIVDESGISKSSNAAKEAMELAEQGKFRQAQKVVDDYAKFKEIADEYDVSNGYFISSDSAQEIKDKIAAGDVSGARQLAKQQNELKAYGFSADSGLTNYNKAKSVIPGLTTKEFATTYKSMDANGKNGISQTEFLDYLNSQNITPERAQQYLDAYGGWENKKGQKKKLVGSSGHYELKY